MNQPPLNERIDNDFSFHPGTEVTGPLHDKIRQACKELAYFLVETCPPSRELSLSLTALEETMHWANAAVAKNLAS